MRKQFRVFGQVPVNGEAERAQFERVIPEVEAAALSRDDWAMAVLSAPYRHRAGSRIENDSDWEGEIDILLIAKNRLVIYELKGYTVDLRYCPTNDRDWKIKRANDPKPWLVPSTFIQVSKQRAYLLQDSLEQFRRTESLGADPHFVVDARVVYKEGSDLSGFFYAIPKTEGRSSFEENVLSRIESDSDRRFVYWCYSLRESGTGKHRLRKLPRGQYERLKAIYVKAEIVPRTAAWFAPITESQITDDYQSTGSDRFELTPELAERFAVDLLYRDRGGQFERTTRSLNTKSQADSSDLP